MSAILDVFNDQSSLVSILLAACLVACVISVVTAAMRLFLFALAGSAILVVVISFVGHPLDAGEGPSTQDPVTDHMPEFMVDVGQSGYPQAAKQALEQHGISKEDMLPRSTLRKVRQTYRDNIDSLQVDAIQQFIVTGEMPGPLADKRDFVGDKTRQTRDAIQDFYEEYSQ